MYSQIFTFVIFAFGLLTITIAKSLDFPLSNACPTPSKQVLGCLSEWTCRHVINLDLRCLLNINSHPLLGNLLATNGITGGLLDGLLGR
uniref:Uncharacterized protein n=1 Tax=Glossina pallidipes TaxID=7398 RepID=A0A1B0AG06_GLOPL